MGRELMHEIEYYDGRANSFRFCYGWLVFVDLMIRFHERMSTKHGHDYVDQVR